MALERVVRLDQGTGCETQALSRMGSAGRRRIEELSLLDPREECTGSDWTERLYPIPSFYTGVEYLNSGLHTLTNVSTY